MISLALSTVRGRIPAFTGALVALLCSAILVSAAAHLTESGLRSSTRAQRYARVDAVVVGDQTMRAPGSDALSSVQLPETARVPRALAAQVEALPEVGSAVMDDRITMRIIWTDSFFASEQRLTDETVRRLCEEEGVDAVISLDRLLFKMKGVLRQGDYLPVESVDVEVLGTVRATVPDGKRVLGTVLLSDTIPVNLEWDLAATEKIEELPLDEVLRGVSSYLADKTHLNFIPHWSSDTRWYYTASGSLWKEAAAYAATDHWEEAAAIWQRLYDRTPEGKAQARLAANLALSEELKGDLSKALEWAKRSHELCRKYLGASAEATRNQACYVSVLEHRIHSDEALRKQF